MRLKERNNLAVYTAFAFLATSQSMSWQFLSYFILHDLQVTNFFTLNVIWSIAPLVMMVTMSLWGSASDKFKKRKPFMLIGFLGYGATNLFSSFVSNGFQYSVVIFIGSIFAASAIPAGQAYLTTGTKNKGERIGFFMVAQSAGWFFGAIISGFLYAPLGMFFLFRIATVICIISILICLAFVKEIEPEMGSDQLEVTQNSKSIMDFVRRPGILKLAFAAAFSALGINAIASVMSIVIVDELGGFEFYVGLANAGATLAAISITGYLGKLIDKRGPGGVLIGAYVGYCLFAIGFGLATDPITATIFFAMPVYALASTAAISFASKLSSDAERGRAMGLINGAQNAGAAFGPILGGVFIEYVFHSVQPVSWLGVVFNIIALVLAISLYPIAKKYRRQDPQISDGKFET
ncbi:MAG: MFS transporter [Candidatus Thorarchaeota archaeon]